MPERDAIAGIDAPRTRSSLARDLRALSLAPADTVIVHSSLSAIGWVAGGPVAVVQALLDVLGDAGTLVMPTQSADNSDPAAWENPPVPQAWWPTIRAEMPAFDPAVTPTRGMGRVPELFRTWPGVMRSAHPALSFAALGPRAREIVEGHGFDDAFGEASPLGRLYLLDARILLLGVGYDSNTSLHLAEYRLPGMPRTTNGAAATVDGIRKWVTYSDVVHLDSDELFPPLGAAFEAAHLQCTGKVGSAESRLLPMRALLDFAVPWLAGRLEAAK
ncbi:MAG: AAC(3) family N-acetyltransferase [Thermaerobacter sp.]|nr:AAC(3) family N-acetyltransferase [Thermaerobacter sp.]